MFYAAYDSDFLSHEDTFSLNELRKILYQPPREIKKYANQLRKNKSKIIKNPNTNSTDNSKGKSNHNSDPAMILLEDIITIESTNKRMQERGLLKYRECGPRYYTIKLKLTGWDLGNKYNCWPIRTGLWFAEYKYHWIWVIISFLTGVISTLLINWVSTYLQRTPGVK